jgi:RNA polymerase sigma-70 factor (ECF subfamily)
MVAVRIDPRLAARIDISDVVQETLADAADRLSEYLRQRPLPFYPWLRQIGQQRLIALYRQHVDARKRSVDLECISLPDESAMQLAQQFVAATSSPSEQAIRKEQRVQVRTALRELSPPHRAVLVMRHLEQMTLAEIAAALGISEAAVQSRYRRAAQQLHRRLRGEFADDLT